MVIGGIIVDNRTETRTQVPWLGDIPILGDLFARETDSNDRIALYFFVTPHILHDKDFADLAEISYRKKLEAADTIGYERVRVIDPNFGRGESDIDLSGFDLPLYASPERGEVGGGEVGLDPMKVNERLRAATHGDDDEHAADPDGSDDAQPEPQSTEPQSTEPQSTESQSTESQSTQPQPVQPGAEAQ